MILSSEAAVNGFRRGPGHAGDAGDAVNGGVFDRFQTAEVFQQLLLPLRANAGQQVKGRLISVIR
jgi:hypothetical protein